MQGKSLAQPGAGNVRALHSLKTPDHKTWEKRGQIVAAESQQCSDETGPLGFCGGLEMLRSVQLQLWGTTALLVSFHLQGNYSLSACRLVLGCSCFLGHSDLQGRISAWAWSWTETNSRWFLGSSISLIAVIYWQGLSAGLAGIVLLNIRHSKSFCSKTYLGILLK